MNLNFEPNYGRVNRGGKRQTLNGTTAAYKEWLDQKYVASHGAHKGRSYYGWGIKKFSSGEADGHPTEGAVNGNAIRRLLEEAHRRAAVTTPLDRLITTVRGHAAGKPTDEQAQARHELADVFLYLLRDRKPRPNVQALSTLIDLTPGRIYALTNHGKKNLSLLPQPSTYWAFEQWECVDKLGAFEKDQRPLQRFYRPPVNTVTQSQRASERIAALNQKVREENAARGGRTWAQDVLYRARIAREGGAEVIEFPVNEVAVTAVALDTAVGA